MSPFVVYTRLSSLPEAFRSEIQSVLAKGNPDRWINTFDIGYLLLLIPLSIIAGLFFYHRYIHEKWIAPREFNAGEILLTAIFGFIFVGTLYHLWLLLSAGSTGWLITNEALVGLEGRKTVVVPWSVVKNVRWGTRIITVKKEADTGRVRFFNPTREEERQRAREGRPLRIIESKSTVNDLHVEIEGHETITIFFGDDYQRLDAFRKNMEEAVSNHDSNLDFTELAKVHSAPLLSSSIRPYVLVASFFLSGPLLAYFLLFPYVDGETEEYLADKIFGQNVQRKSEAVKDLPLGGKLSCGYYERGFPQGRYINEVEKMRRRYLDAECEEHRWLMVDLKGESYYRRGHLESLLKTMIGETNEPQYAKELEALQSTDKTEGWYEYAKESGMLDRIKAEKQAYEQAHADDDLAPAFPVEETTLVQCISEGWSRTAVLHLKNGTPPEKCLNQLLRLKTLSNDNSCRGREYMLEKLLEAGAPVDVEDIEGSLLHMAVTRKMEKAARILIAYGADREKKDLRGRTPLELARELGHKSFEEILTAEHATLEEDAD